MAVRIDCSTRSLAPPVTSSVGVSCQRPCCITPTRTLDQRRERMLRALPDRTQRVVREQCICSCCPAARAARCRSCSSAGSTPSDPARARSRRRRCRPSASTPSIVMAVPTLTMHTAPRSSACAPIMASQRSTPSLRRFADRHCECRRPAAVDCTNCGFDLPACATRRARRSRHARAADVADQHALGARRRVEHCLERTSARVQSACTARRIAAAERRRSKRAHLMRVLPMSMSSSHRTSAAGSQAHFARSESPQLAVHVDEQRAVELDAARACRTSFRRR